MDDQLPKGASEPIERFEKDKVSFILYNKMGLLFQTIRDRTVVKRGLDLSNNHQENGCCPYFQMIANL